MRERLVDEGVALVVWALLVGVGGGLAGRWAMRWAAEGVRVGVPRDRGVAGPLDVQGPRRGKGR